MDMVDLTSISSLASGVAAIRKGPRALAGWLDQRTERRYEDFIASAKAGGVFPENAAAMTADDLFAVLRALELDMEGEKAELYGRMAYSIAVGAVREGEKRHFIRSLRELTFDQVQRLRKAWVARHFNLYPGAGSGNKEQKEFLGSGGPTSIDGLAFQRWGLIIDRSLSPMGERFVRACFPEDALQPDAIGEREWEPLPIHIVCNEMGTHACAQFLLRLSNEGHARAIQVTNGAAIRGRTQRPMFPVDPFFVLLTADPQRLTDEWETVEGTTRGSKRVVVVTLGESLDELPVPLDRFTRIDASKGREEDACATLLAMLDPLDEQRS